MWLLVLNWTCSYIRSSRRGLVEGKESFNAAYCLKHRTSTANPSAYRISRLGTSSVFYLVVLMSYRQHLMFNYLTTILQTSRAHYLLDPDTCQSLHSLMEMSLSRLILILPLWALLSNVIYKDKKKGPGCITKFWNQDGSLNPLGSSSLKDTGNADPHLWPGGNC